jgi:hypothetical protein
MLNNYMLVFFIIIGNLILEFGAFWPKPNMATISLLKKIFIRDSGTRQAILSPC